MSERILRALMQLFAIIAQVDETSENSEEGEVTITSTEGRKIIESFLRTELSSQFVDRYLELFDSNLNTLHAKQRTKDADRKRNSLNSVKVLKICTQINEELRQKQKIIVLLRIFEFIQSNVRIQEQELEFATIVAEAFNIPNEEFNLIQWFIFNDETELRNSKQTLFIERNPNKTERSVFLEGLDKELVVVHIETVNILFFKYYGNDSLSLNGQFINNDRAHIFTQGSTLKTSKSKPLYYSDVISQFFQQGKSGKITYAVENITFFFKGNRQGLHNFTFSEESGKLVGIMGGSGTGKSTLLNILNGQYPPSTGTVSINGIDIHKEKEKLRGLIGYISQDDLLIEELTVYQNLYFNARMCFGDCTEYEIKKKVVDTLRSVGLYDFKDLIVGDPLDKVISGGQRKRLNIALELIREPEVLIVDEPTSGLSSRDSENIMDLLKEMTYSGKLIFVVIHQPSSDIFKMFDRLFIIDQGGFPIYDGNPIEAVTYFKHTMHQGNAEESECPLCGNVNPEQIFNIIETRIVDEYGELTETRKVQPKEWYSKYLNTEHRNTQSKNSTVPEPASQVASRFTQFKIFFLRDLLSKISNRQYLLITLLEAPLLGLMLSFFVKFFAENDGSNKVYSFYQNENLPQYIFIAVIVSLFLGLTVSAEEIHKDKKLLKRESFLDLSRHSYLLSKLFILFIVSAIQTTLFVGIGNLILEVNGLFWHYWIILFSTSCAANVLGLNISSAFNSAKVIYIVVPILIIPQLLFSGVIVKFDKLHPMISRSNSVPWIGNVMISRWAYEGLAVTQFRDNKQEKAYFDDNIRKFDAQWKKDYWIPEMEQLNNTLLSHSATKVQKEDARIILLYEIEAEMSRWKNLQCPQCISDLEYRSYSSRLQNTIHQFLEILKDQYTNNFNESNDKIELKKNQNQDKYNTEKNTYFNEALHDLLTNRLESTKIQRYNGALIRKDNPVYYPYKGTNFMKAHFYSPSKNVFGYQMDTFYFNVIALWFFTLLFHIALYFDILKRGFLLMEYYRERLTKKPTR